MEKKLLSQAVTKTLCGFLLAFLLVFAPAGTLNFWNGWLFLFLLFVPMIFVGIWLFTKNPELLKKRLNNKEKESEQKLVVLLTGLLFILCFIIAGLNFRFKWITLPDWVVILPAFLFLLGYVMYADVMRENTYLSRTVEIQEGQKVIDTGLYGIVRHPMYTATILIFLSTPLVLGSLISFVLFLFYPLIIAKRIRNEEQLLEKELKGYAEYKTKVKYKLIPYIW